MKRHVTDIKIPIPQLSALFERREHGVPLPQLSALFERREQGDSADEADTHTAESSAMENHRKRTGYHGFRGFDFVGLISITPTAAH